MAEEKRYYVLKPEVPGGLGDGTSVDNSTFPPTIENLHFVFQGWLGDDLITTFPCYLMTSSGIAVIEKHNLSGYIIENIKISYSENFRILHPNKKMPDFKRMLIVGRPGDDFILTNKNRLAVSEWAFRILKENLKINYCEVEAFSVLPQ